MSMKKLIGFMLSMVLLFSTDAFAASVVLKGGDSAAAGSNISIALYSSEANTDNITASDIVYINQVKADENGNWYLKIPFEYMNLDDVQVVSNKTSESYVLNDAGAAVYLSESGNDEADGKTADTAVKTLEKALELVEDGTIYISGTIKPTADFVWSKSNKNITISGVDSASALDISEIASFSIGCDTVFESIAINMEDDGNGNSANIIFAEGNRVVMADTVSMNKYAIIYAGSETATVQSTDLEIYGGKYLKIFASSLNNEVVGDCNLTVGGNANSEFTISEIDGDVPTVYSGGWNCVVGGSCTVNLKDNIKFTEVYGGSQGGKGNIAGDSLINISGGEYMNIYSCYSNMENVGSNTVLTMTGGTAEAIFGGGKGMIYGSTSMYLLGGTVTRRIYGGCYNNWSGSWSSDNYVVGNIGIAIGGNMNLPLNYDINRGIFGGSRTKENHSDEISTIVFLDDTYSVLQGKIGDISGWGSTLKSHHDYIVDAGENGKAEFAFENRDNTVKIIPDKNYKAVVGGSDLSDKCYTLSSAVTEIDFEKMIKINDVSMTYLDGTADFSVDASLPEEQCTVIVAVYDGEKMIGVSADTVNSSEEAGDISVNCTLEGQKAYTIKAFVWKDVKTVLPLCELYVKTITNN